MAPDRDHETPMPHLTPHLELAIRFATARTDSGGNGLQVSIDVPALGLSAGPHDFVSPFCREGSGAAG